MSAAVQLRRWRENPVTFVRECLGAEPDEWQADVLTAFPKHNRIALKACKGPGKSTVKAWCGWNFLLTREHPKVIATSITGTNLRDGLWTEFAKWQQRSELLKKAFTWNAERITYNKHPETWWASARQWAKEADPSQQANTLAGIHADYVLFLVDEAGGIPDGVISAAEAALSTGIETKLFISGNPTHLEGPLYRACTTDRSRWFVREITGDPDNPKRSPRIILEWAKEQIEKFGRDSPWVQINVFGEFPPSQSNALIGLDDVARAAGRSFSEGDYIHENKILGVDVAREGDDRSVLFPRQGRVAMAPRVFRNLDLMSLSDQVALYIERWKPDAVAIDQTGIGAGVVDRLRQLGFPVEGIESAGKSTSGRQLNRRAEMWWEMGEWIRSGGCIPNDPALISELAAPTYTFNSLGKTVLESKASLKQRGLSSPDMADALALTFSVRLPAKGFNVPGLYKNHKAVTEYDSFTERQPEQYEDSP